MTKMTLFEHATRQLLDKPKRQHRARRQPSLVVIPSLLKPMPDWIEPSRPKRPPVKIPGKKRRAPLA
jgi:hypothetical protein